MPILACHPLMSIFSIERFAAVLKALCGRTRLDSLRKNDGAVAVEFALVAAPFFALIVAILDLALLFTGQAALETATEKAARLVLTGQAQGTTTGATPLTQAQFQSQLCTYLPTFTCSGVMVDLQTVTSYSSANTSAPTLTYDSHGQVTNTWQYAAGGPGTIQVLRVMYQWPVFPGPLNLNFANLSNGYYLMMATAVFRNEPP
jgi:Flp pilus assembly protein TadG